MATFDVIIIGGGPGGYVSAIRCAQLGLKTACVEGRDTLGGTCLNVGCIPSKALLNATHALHEAEHNFAKMGLIGAAPAVDWAKMLAYKDDVIGQNTKGIEFLFKKNKVTWLKGWGTIPAPGQVKVGDEVHSAKNIVIATGSEPSSLPGVTVDEETVVTSTGALALGKIDLEEKTTDLRLKLKGKLAVDLADYQRAFAQANDQSLELDQLVPHILAAFIDADKGFQAWRKAQPASS